jgi:energy-coupling factor transporter ATP-binding protein EcfA2
MIERLTCSNFSVLRDATFEFAAGINVVIGSNATGKSHLLKLAYACVRWSQEMAQRERTQVRPDKATQQKELANKLMGVFRCEGIGRLSTRGAGVQRTDVSIGLRDRLGANFDFRFSTKSVTDAILVNAPDLFYDGEAVFFPTKEMLTMYPGFAALYRNYALQIDETYYDLCLTLGKPLPRGPKLLQVRPLLDAVEKIIGGSIQLENDRFTLVQPGGGRFEIPLVAEGYRKLGAVAYLLANGALAKQSVLFWDEPETNLNPAIMVQLARLLVEVAANGTQVILATHSLVMMRELSMLLQSKPFKRVDRRFYALAPTRDGLRVRLTVGGSADEIEPIDSLDAEIDQSERYLAAQESL